MTTSVKVSAHVSENKEVRVDITTGPTGEVNVLQDGETREFLVYDDRTISVVEVLKVASDAAPSK